MDWNCPCVCRSHPARDGSCSDGNNNDTAESVTAADRQGAFSPEIGPATDGGGHVTMDEAQRLIPILREGVAIIKMIFYKKVRDRLALKYADRDSTFVNRIAGAVTNDIFGTPNTEESFVRFVDENRACVMEEMDSLATSFEEMRIPLTDALRVQFLCDDREGINTESTLARAKDLGVLIVGREVPLPKNFLNLVRTLGSSFGLILPPVDLEDDTGKLS